MSKGFSLIELLVVVAIIAILAVIAIPQYNKYRANAIYSSMETQLKKAKAWAEMKVEEVGRFPEGTCDASTADGTVKCQYNASGDNIEISPNGDLHIDSPFKVSFYRCSKHTDLPNCTISGVDNNLCGWILVEGGLKDHTNSGVGKICTNTCEATEKIYGDTNLYGVMNGYDCSDLK